MPYWLPRTAAGAYGAGEPCPRCLEQAGCSSACVGLLANLISGSQSENACAAGKTGRYGSRNIASRPRLQTGVGLSLKSGSQDLVRWPSP